MVAPEAAGAVDCQVVPLLVKTLPVVLGATNVGADVPLPKITLLAVRVARLVPPLATGNVPVTPVLSGRPVPLVKTTADGVPRLGVVNIGLVSVLLVSVSVLVAVTRFVGVMIADRTVMAYSGCVGQTIVFGKPLCVGISRSAWR